MTHPHPSLANEVAQYRQPEQAVDPAFLNRWSPRAFKSDPVSSELLMSVLEAAKWAPSANNEQPWRYIVARTPEALAKFYTFINPGNLDWCAKAPVLLLAISNKMSSRGTNNRAHAFDAGTAWGYLALEASRQGLVTHAMGGFQPDLARETLGIPEEYELHAVIAIGYRGDKSMLNEQQQEREVPSSRRPLHASLFEGEFGKPIGPAI